MAIEAWLKKAVQKLGEAGIGTARLDTLILLEDELHKDRAQLLAHPELELTVAQINRLDAKIGTRATHMPISYVRGHVEFYGSDFLVTPAVLEPRPESETMIDLLKALRIKQPFILGDVGAGSGALGITAKLELPTITVEMLELNDEAIKICKKNKQRLKCDILITKSNLLSASKLAHGVLLANLPYVPDDYHINEAAAMEPRIAIFGGPDGLDLYRQLFTQLTHKKHVQYVLTESLPFQHKDLAAIAKQAGYDQKTEDDFIQVFARVNER